MKVIEMKKSKPTLNEVIEMAGRELVVLKKENGAVFAVTQVDDFDVEVELLKNNPEFMAWMADLSKEQPTISARQLREELGL